ncbi:MAG: fibronectin type III domain-containing protein, partial [Acidimicrobiales bacterium]|nr:fibronectin type III domain-containing protein [Acidimicrobiales bacterium]
EAKGLTSKTRKFVVAWDDTDSVDSFCGLGNSIPDTTPGSSNLNEAQTFGAMFAAVEPQCWTADVAAHEMMHTLGAVQTTAPNATPNGHCTDESDLMCYVDGAGVVMRQICPPSQESLLDCNNDDYFHVNPPAGNYLKNNWNTATSGFLDATGSVGPPIVPTDLELEAGGGSVTASWDPPAYNGGSALLAYSVATSTGRTMLVPASSTSAVIEGLADGVEVSLTVTAINKMGSGSGITAGPVVPSPLVSTIVTTADSDSIIDIARGPDGSIYASMLDRIVNITSTGVITDVVAGLGGGENTLALNTAAYPGAIAIAPNGDLFYFDTWSSTIRRLSGGRVNTVAGNGSTSTSGDGGSALNAGVWADAIAVASNSTTVFFVDANDAVVRRFTVGSTINKVAGTLGVSGFSGDGAAATSARFDTPMDLTIDASGNVYVADTHNSRIRRFMPGGNISTVAGDGSSAVWSGDTWTATATGIGYPAAIDWSADKGLLIETTGQIRRLEGSKLFVVAGDIFTATSDADGLPAMNIDFAWNDHVTQVLWHNKTLFLVSKSWTSDTTRLRKAGPWNSATPPTTPSAPIVAPIATAGKLSAKLTWVPAANGASTVTQYQIKTSPGGSWTTVNGDGTSTVLTGLTAGTSYTFTVRAVNAVGTGAESAPSNAVVPTAAPAFDPFSSWAALVDRQFVDVINRPPTSSERSTWVNQLTQSQKTAGDLVASLRTSSDNTVA